MRWICDVCGSVEWNPKFIGAMSNHDVDNCNGTHQPVYTRDDLVRAIVGQQWAVAIAVCAQDYGVGDDEWDNAYDDVVRHVASLPCAVDVVEEMEKA